MPKRKKLKHKEKNLLGEAEIVHLPRDLKGRFSSKGISKSAREGEDHKPRSIKIVKVKGSYGSYLVKERKFITNFKPNILGDLFILISLLPLFKIMLNLM